MTIYPYFNFNGDCEAALNFYAETLGGKIEMLMRFSESPIAAETSADFQNKVLHARLDIGSQAILASDAPAGHYTKPAGTYTFVRADSVKEANRIFSALMAGGTVHMPMAATFWSGGFGMGADRYGVHWMVDGGQAPA